MRLNLRELLRFYDYKVDGSSGHATAINAVIGEDLAVALLEAYFGQSGKRCQVLPESPRLGTQKGSRLDKWLIVDSMIYQVEIKNWSAHSLGGQILRNGLSDDELTQYRKKRWNDRMRADNIPKHVAAKKVLEKMPVPAGCDKLEHKAMLCFWEPLHPNGECMPLFKVDLTGQAFDSLTIFSMSNYIAQYLAKGADEYIEVQMKDADARIEWLSKIYCP